MNTLDRITKDAYRTQTLRRIINSTATSTRKIGRRYAHLSTAALQRATESAAAIIRDAMPRS